MIDPQVAQELIALRREFEQKRQQDLAALQLLTVKVQGYATKTQALQDTLATIVGPLPATPHLSLDTRPRP